MGLPSINNYPTQRNHTWTAAFLYFIILLYTLPYNVLSLFACLSFAAFWRAEAARDERYTYLSATALHCGSTGRIVRYIRSHPTCIGAARHCHGIPVFPLCWEALFLRGRRIVARSLRAHLSGAIWANFNTLPGTNNLWVNEYIT